MVKSIGCFDLAAVSIGTRIRKKEYVRYLKKFFFDRTLECGCGAGVYTTFLKTVCKYFVGIDINSELIRMASANLDECDFCVSDVMHLPFKDNCFDLLVAADVVEHTSNAYEALKEIYRVIKKQGMCSLSVPSNNWEFVCKLLGLTKYSFGHNYLFSRQEIVELVDMAGFDVVYYKPIQGFFSALLEGAIVKTCGFIYGEDAVKNSRMASITAGKKCISWIYIIGSRILYPLFLFLDFFTPPHKRYEHFLVLKKR